MTPPPGMKRLLHGEVGDPSVHVSTFGSAMTNAAHFGATSGRVDAYVKSIDEGICVMGARSDVEVCRFNTAENEEICMLYSTRNGNKGEPNKHLTSYNIVVSGDVLFAFLTKDLMAGTPQPINKTKEAFDEQLHKIGILWNTRYMVYREVMHAKGYVTCDFRSLTDTSTVPDGIVESSNDVLLKLDKHFPGVVPAQETIHNLVMQQFDLMFVDEVLLYKQSSDPFKICPYCHGDDDECTLCGGEDVANLRTLDDHDAPIAPTATIDLSPTQPYTPNKRAASELSCNRSVGGDSDVSFEDSSGEMPPLAKRMKTRLYEFDGVFHCMECNEFLGDMNPRQLCCKIECRNYGMWHHYSNGVLESIEYI